ncbi:MAG: hypothetical protein EOO63_15840 [Hymenobacter sp.]|nr:MAG: hypothetical protein EOO63_15840 [Hymenobacter sp.]
MLPALRVAVLLTILLTSACHRASDVVQPITLVGSWRLTVSGGGITGMMSPVPAGSDYQLVFGPDSAYARYDNGKLMEASTYQLRSQPGYPGGPNEQILVLKTTNTPGNQPFYYPYYVTLLTGRELHFTTGGGCALNSVYERVGAAGLPISGR